MKKIVFVSNFLNHHQVPLCESFFQTPDVEFRFIALEDIPEERKKLGYADFTSRPYHIEWSKNPVRARDLIDAADAVIAGGEPVELLRHRLEEDKLTFRYSERLYKKGSWRRLHPHAYQFVNDRFLKYRNNRQFYVLCAGAYLSKDLELWHFPVAKCLKWGYFPDAEDHAGRIASNQVPQILFAGRLISWKHPEDMISLAEYLKENHIQAKLTIVGDGGLFQSLQQEVSEKHLESLIEMTGALPYSDVYERMAASDIFAFCSDRQEGWGAVLNEAMQLGCAPVASVEAGASRYLIRNEENGLLYTSRSTGEFIEKTVALIKGAQMRDRIAAQARKTITTKWNAQTAAQRLLQFIEDRKAFDDGPLSIAEVMKEDGAF
ncbi:MAG: glycosyltransferase [Bulleidia sp.]|nr:glycosyltransferase [Bulleidia sp.]